MFEVTQNEAKIIKQLKLVESSISKPLFDTFRYSQHRSLNENLRLSQKENEEESDKDKDVYVEQVKHKEAKKEVVKEKPETPVFAIPSNLEFDCADEDCNMNSIESQKGQAKIGFSIEPINQTCAPSDVSITDQNGIADYFETLNLTDYKFS